MWTVLCTGIMKFSLFPDPQETEAVEMKFESDSSVVYSGFRFFYDWVNLGGKGGP